MYEGIYDGDLEEYPQTNRNLNDVQISTSFSNFNTSILSFHVFSSVSLIGTVYVELGTYLRADNKQEIKFECQYPIFHPEEGIRGELYLKFKIKLVREDNHLRNIQNLNEVPQYNGNRQMPSLLIDFFSSLSPPDPNIYD